VVEVYVLVMFRVVGECFAKLLCLLMRDSPFGMQGRDGRR